VEIPKLTRVKNSRILKIKNKDFEYELEITKNGFTLWVFEANGDKRALHWLIDASTLKETNNIFLTRGNRIWKVSLKEEKYPYFRKFKVVKRKSKH
jgi:hypothetical protein